MLCFTAMCFKSTYQHIHDKDCLGVISSSNNSDSITHYIPTILIFALGSKISYTDEYLSSESENNQINIFDSKTM